MKWREKQSDVALLQGFSKFATAGEPCMLQDQMPLPTLRRDVMARDTPFQMYQFPTGELWW
jgi:hypothetical protein